MTPREEVQSATEPVPLVKGPPEPLPQGMRRGVRVRALQDGEARVGLRAW